MCDYSLRMLRSRAAEAGEELVLHRFEMGVLGFVSNFELREMEMLEPDTKRGFWQSMREWLLPRKADRLCAICVAPGTNLHISGIPEKVQRSLCIAGSELVSFTEVSSRRYSCRDALLLRNGTRVLLQDLPEGIEATVLSSPPEPDEARVSEELLVA